MANTTANVEKPQAGQSVPVTLSEGQATVSCKAGDIESMQMTDGGKLVMTFKDGASITVNNFQEFASKGSVLTLADGTTVNTVDLLSGVAMKPQAAANDGAEILVGQPPAGQTIELELAPGQKYNFAFDDAAKESVTQEAGALIITFQDGGKLVLKNFSDALDALDPVQVSVGGEEISLSEFAEIMKLADAMNDKLGNDQKPVMAELREEAGNVNNIEPAAGQQEQQQEQQNQPLESQKTSMQDVRQDMTAMAEQLAGIEPAAGGQAGGGAARAGGFGFQSAVDAANVIPLTAIGPIGPTALEFGLPGPQDPYYIPEETDPLGPPSVVANLGLNDAQVKEDGSVFVPIVATIGVNGDGDEVLTLTVTGIPSTWNPVFTGGGTYDPGTGTWTITMPPGTNYTGGVTVTPPAESDVDLPNVTATVSVYDPDTNSSQTATDTFDVVVDAVADLPHVNAPDNSDVRGTPLAVNITGGLGSDQDGSESISHYTVTGLPKGFAFNQGTYDPVTDVWTFTPAELIGLTVTPPAIFTGSIPMVVTIYNQENPTDREFDTADNTNSASDPFTLTWTPKINPPDITIDNQVDFVNGQVKEDGTVTIPVKAVLSADSVPGEYLTVKITGIPASWNPTFSDGTYDPLTGEWTVTVPPNTDFNGSFTVTPPAESDVDLSGLVGTATATQPPVNGFPELTSSDSDSFGIIVDAVADKPHVDAPDNSGVRGTPLAVNITGGLGSDQDGSESITHYTVSGLPAGFSFNKGSYDPVTDVWTFTPAQITGLTVTPPPGFHGSVPLNVTIYNKDTPTDGEYDTADNTNSASDPFTLTWTPKITPPDITIDNQVDFVNGQVKEDGSVTIPVKAVLAADAVPGEYLTVKITGIPSSWGFSAPVGSYDPLTGEWTITLPPNTNLDTAITFTPPAQSDVDLSGLNGTATATQPTVDGVPGLTASDSDAFGIITDAVADKPHVDAPDNAGARGTPLAVTITGGLGADQDGSESITHYTITGVPAGFSFSAGTRDPATGIWTFQPNELTGLTVTPPANYSGKLNLNVTIYNKDTPTDGEYDTTDNTNSASDPFTLTWTPKITPPDITINNQVDFVDGQVKEDGFVDIPVRAVLSADAIPGEYLTVKITGIPSNWGFSAPVGSYNAATGEWTITLPANTNLDTVLRFTPPADSDIDLSGLVGTATATQPPANGFPELTASDSDAFGIVVDAVADKPTLTAHAPYIEEGQTIPITINGATTDRDGSEIITHYQISNVQDGFTFNKGTNLGGGVWQFTPDEINGLVMSPPTATTPAHFYTKVTVFVTENPVSDDEYDYSDNHSSTTVDMKIWIQSPVLLVGKNVDDLPGSNTNWEVGGGKGRIDGGGASDILIGDVGGSSMEAQTKNYNIVLMLDVSGSMDTRVGNETRLSLLVKAVKNLVADFHEYEGGEIRVNLIGFAGQFAGSFIFTAGEETDYEAAIQHLNSLSVYTQNQYTNYEAAMQDALDWYNSAGHYSNNGASDRPIPGAENISYFISDGQPNRYLNNNGSVGGNGDNESAWNTAMGQINGSGDSTNEIEKLQAKGEVIAVGISIGNTIERLDQIDTGGDALNVFDPRDLDAVLKGASPLNKLAEVGDDGLFGGDGQDLIFGDAINTDALAQAMGLNTPAGAGWEVFKQLENRPNWDRADTIEYIRQHAEELARESTGSNNVGRAGGNDEIHGGGGNDIIFGQEGQDTIDGSTGNDHIWGGSGNDILYGGSGADVFHFENSAAQNGVDTIRDFSFAENDALDLSAMLTAFDPTQDAINEFVFATTVNGNTVVSVDVTGSGNIANAQAVAILQGVTGVTNVEDLLTQNSGGNVA